MSFRSDGGQPKRRQSGKEEDAATCAPPEDSDPHAAAVQQQQSYKVSIRGIFQLNFNFLDAGARGRAILRTQRTRYGGRFCKDAFGYIKRPKREHARAVSLRNVFSQTTQSAHSRTPSRIPPESVVSKRSGVSPRPTSPHNLRTTLLDRPLMYRTKTRLVVPYR